MATLEVPDFDDYVVEEKVVAYPDPHDKWEKIVIPQSITDMDAMVNFFLEKHGLTLQNWSMSKRNEDGKVTGASCTSGGRGMEGVITVGLARMLRFLYSL